MTAADRPAPVGPAPPSEMGLQLRRVMRQWLTGVAILTARDGDRIRGMTCNSFNSVSDSPATVLVTGNFLQYVPGFGNGGRLGASAQDDRAVTLETVIGERSTAALPRVARV